MFQWSFFQRRRLKDSHYSYLFEPYEGDEVVVLDTETTGLNVRKDEILSIGAVKLKGNKILTSATFEVYVKPSQYINEKSITIHGIRPCDVQNGISIHNAIKALIDFIGNRPIVGYYLEFDMNMLNKYIKPWLGISLPNKRIEVSGLYYDQKVGLIPKAPIDLRFETIMKALAVPNMGQHNAVNDAIMTAMIYLKLTHEKG